MISGYATSSGTSTLAARHPELFYGRLGQTGLRVSQAGFGGYRITASIPEHAAALRRALESGVNLIDTSANYADGRSEELVGGVVAQMLSAGRLRREEVVLVSKAGYLQGRNYEMSRERQLRGQSFPDLVPYAEGLEHCIHPEFLDDQLSRSLARLGLETLDVYLLHNPEYFLGWARKLGQPPDQAQAEYMRRLEKAFRHLEAEVSAGRIRRYGISSNTFPVGHTDPQFSCLERIWQTAESISSDHHFAVIQMPMNLFETGAVLLANQPSGKTPVAFARQKNLGVLINRPLNAVAHGRLIRLADVENTPRLPADETRRRIAVLRKAEADFIQRILPGLDLEPAIRSRLEVLILSADSLDGSWEALQGYDHWRQVRDDVLLPRVRGVWAYLEANPDKGRPAAAWLPLHRKALEEVLRAIGGHYAETVSQEAARIKTLLAEADPDWSAETPLSRLALRALRSTAGISCVLVGMRREEYVADMISELQVPVPVSDRKGSWTALQKTMGSIR